MSDIVSDIKQVEYSLSTMSSDVHDIGTDYPDAKSKLYSLENDIERLLSDVKRIREKMEIEGDQN